MHMRLFLLSAAAVVGAATLSAQSPLIYSNGPLITENHPSGPGIFSSRLQSGAPPAGLQLNVIGFGAQQGAGNALADDFIVCNAMVIDGIEVYGYATNAIPAPPAPVTGVFVEISSTDPAVGITPVAGSPGIANNQLANSTVTWPNLYRVTTTTLTATNRAVMSSRVNLNPPIVLAPGTYWLIFQFTGVNFVPPITTIGSSITGNAKQRVGAAGAWNPIVDTGAPALPVPVAQGLPFNLYGTSGNTVGAITNTGLPACGATTITVAGAPVLGGFVQTTLGGTTGFPIIGYGFSNIPTGFCGCVVGHEFAAVLFGAQANQLFVPANPQFCGTNIFVQGVDFGGVGGCPNPPLTFTDTWSVLIGS
jgi:hypothetical protein